MDDVTSAVVTTAASINTNATIATSLTTGTQLPGTTTSATTTKSPPLTKKSSNTLSVDRAAFLLLRVKKAFKKKRQQRKEKQAQLASAAAAGAQRCNSRRTPAPLLRSRTLPAIVVPGIPVASLHTDKNPLRYEDCVSGKLGANGQRWSSLLMRHATPQVHNNNYMESGANIGWNTLSLPKDDTNLVYRRKSSGSTPHSNISEQPYSRSQSMQQKQLLQQDQLEQHQQQQHQQQQCQQQQQQQQQYQLQEHMTDALDDLECHADGSLLLRIPAPHVVAARAYRLASNKHVTSKTTLNCGNQVPAGSDTVMTGVYNAHPAALSTYESANSTCTSSSSSSSTGATALTRLAKLLHQSSSSSKVVATPVNAIEPQFATIPLPLAAGFDNIDEAPRRLSWERRKDSSALQRSGSIDSFAEIVWSVSPRPSLDIPRNVAPFSKRPSASSLYSNCSNTSQNAQLNINYGSDLNTGGGGSGGSAASSRRESLLSPSSTRRNKVTRIINDNVLSSNNNCDETTAVKLRHHQVDSDTKNSNEEALLTQDKIVHCTNNNNHNNNNNIIHQHYYKNNNQKILHLAEITKVATVHTARNSCPSTDKLSNMKNFQMPHAITATTAKISGKITASSSTRKFMKDFNEMPENINDRNNTKIAEVTITKEKSNSINAKNAKMSADVENSISTTHVHSKSTTSNNNSNHKNNNNNKKNNNNNNISKNNLITTTTATTTSTETTTTANVLTRTKGCGNTPHHGKMSKKQLKLAQAQLDKLTQINLHQHALFSAIEHGHLDKARTILESTDIDVNSINSDGLSALDVAVLSNNRSMTRMLLQHGALESSQLTNENIGTKLNNQLKDAESRIHDLSDCLEAPYQPSLSARSSISSIIIGNTSSTVTGCTGNEVDKQIGIWERRVKGLRRMLLGWDQAQPPDGPLSVTVDVTSENTITVQILEPIDGAISTKFKVQWSTRADFGNIVGECESMEWNSFHGNMGTLCYIGNLTQGRRYYVRAACGNVKGWGPYKNSTPSNIIPSSWKDLNNREDRYTGRQRILDNLFTAVRLARPADVSELTLNSSNVQKRNPKKKTTIKQLFSVASKFQKNLRRGIYLASIIYCEDKVLVTSEDCLPVIEIDDSYPSTLHSDYHWLMKVAFTWDNVKSLRTDMERNLTSTVQFRTKLLAAVCQMQSALGLTDLGQLYYKPIRDSHGTVVLTCIQSVKTQKTISILNSRWLPVNKLQKKLFALLEDYNISEMLIASVADQMKYHQASTQRLSPGLYLGYLKMQCSVEQIQVVVPVRTPNVLPHCKIRNNAHITAEEWQALKREPLGHQPNTQRRNSSPRGLSFDLSDSNDAEEPSEVQRLFLRDLTAAAQRLLNYMNVKQEDAGTHRLYDIEVIEHSKDISFLIMCPAVELSCAAPGQAEILLQRDDIISLSIQAFEMIHLRTYQPGIIQKYARLSCILELDTALANHSHRQAFSNSELQLAKERLAKLQELTSSLNAVWKSVRWLMDVIAFARDKNPTRSLVFKEILELAPPSGDTAVENTKETQLLQLPVRDVKFNKSGSGRGSWPGPQVSGSSPLDEEHSRSEQNLGRSAITPTTLTAPSFTSNSQKTGTKETQLLNVADYEGMCSRKNSGDSGDSQYTVHSYYSAMDSGPEIDFNIPASRSDDTLAMAAIDASKQQSALSQRKRTTSNLVCSTTQPPLITVHSSNSVPYLARDLIGSSTSLSLRQSGSTVNDHKIDMVKSKASSSMNLRDGGLYLKTTLSALQTEIKADLGTSTSTAASSSSSNKTNVVKQNSEDDNVSSSSSLTATETTTNANAGIIQVYTAYNTGLATGTSLKLHVTPKTSAREVINLVVQQLNMAAVLKGSNGPIYTPDMLDNFCLVAVIGARERCLRDDFKPLQLQNPWKKGRLYVRQKHELLAAIDHSNRKSHLI